MTLPILRSSKYVSKHGLILAIKFPQPTNFQGENLCLITLIKQTQK